MSTRDVYRALWRHKLYIVVATAGLVVLTWYLTTLATPTYEASVLVRIQQLEDGDPTSSVYALQASERLAETYAEIVDSGALYPPLRSQLTGTLPEELVSQTDVTGDPVEGLDLLWVAAESPDPETAATVAGAAPAALAELIEESGTVGDRVATVTAARVPQEPSSPDLTLNLLVAGALGLILNGLIAVGAEAIRGRLIAPDRAAESFDLPVLARVPSLSLVPLSARPGTGTGGVTPEAGTARAPLATRSREPTP